MSPLCSSTGVLNKVHRFFLPAFLTSKRKSCWPIYEAFLKIFTVSTIFLSRQWYYDVLGVPQLGCINAKHLRQGNFSLWAFWSCLIEKGLKFFTGHSHCLSKRRVLTEHHPPPNTWQYHTIKAVILWHSSLFLDGSDWNLAGRAQVGLRALLRNKVWEIYRKHTFFFILDAKFLWHHKKHASLPEVIFAIFGRKKLYLGCTTVPSLTK